MHVCVEIDCSKIKTFRDLHDEFDEKFGFPDFYGRNMDAWIDCMTSLDCPEDCMTKIHAPVNGFVVIKLLDIDKMIEILPSAYRAIVDSVAFVNFRKMELGESPVLALSYYADPSR